MFRDNNLRNGSNGIGIGLNRRQFLRQASTAGVVGGAGLTSATGTATAHSTDEVDSQHNLFNQTINVPNTDIEVEHSISVTEFTPHCVSGDYVQPFELDVDTIAYDENDGETPKDEAIKSNMMKLTFPENDDGSPTIEIEYDEPEEWGGYPYQEDSGEDYSGWAEDAVVYAVSNLTPYGWLIDGAIVVTEMLKHIVEASDSSDSIRADFVYYDPGRNDPGNLVPQANSWGTFITDLVEHRDWIPIDIRHGFTIQISAWDYYTYRDEFTYYLGVDKYC